MIPPSLPPSAPNNPPLGQSAVEQVPITGLIASIEAILRQPRRVLFQLRQANSGSLIAVLLIIASVAGAIYGVIVGTFSGGDQLWAAPAKIVTGLLVSAFICLPSLYIFSCLGGSQARLVEVCGLVAGLLALMTVLLIGFAPVAWVFSQSTEDVTAMGALHLLFWLIAVYFGLRFLYVGFGHFGDKPGGGLKVWMAIFVLVMFQMTTTLRPIVGQADTLLPAEKKFFLSHWLQCLKMQD